MVRRILRIFDKYITRLSTPHLSNVATLPWEIPKKVILTVLLFVHTSDYLRYLRKKNKLQLLYCNLAVCILLFSASYYLHSRSTASGARYRRSACVEYQPETRTSCVCGLFRHGLNFSRAWCMMQLASGEKDWKHVSTQKVVTLNTCCDVACLTVQLPYITTGCFPSHQHLKKRNKP